MKTKILVILMAFCLLLPFSAMAATTNKMGVPYDSNYGFVEEDWNYMMNYAYDNGYRYSYVGRYSVPNMHFSKVKLDYEKSGEFRSLINNTSVDVTVLRFTRTNGLTPEYQTIKADGGSFTVVNNGSDILYQGKWSLEEGGKMILQTVKKNLVDGGILSTALIIFAILLGVGLLPRLKSWFLRYRG